MRWQHKAAPWKPPRQTNSPATLTGTAMAAEVMRMTRDPVRAAQNYTNTPRGVIHETKGVSIKFLAR